MVRKIFVDSRFRDSGNFANFQTTLATPVLHPKCRAYLDNIHIPNLFYTIHDNAKHIYIVEQWLTNPGTLNEVGHARKRKIALTIGHYDIQSLAFELATRLNLNSFLPAGNIYTVTHITNTGKLTITLTNGGNNPNVNIWSMEYLKAHKDLWIDHTSSQVGTVVDDDCYHALGFTAGGILAQAANLRHMLLMAIRMLCYLPQVNLLKAILKRGIRHCPMVAEMPRCQILF